MPTYYLSLLIKEKILEYMLVRVLTFIKIESKPFSILNVQTDERYKKY